jgi:thiol-disulfide isomerase/thioredoxin
LHHQARQEDQLRRSVIILLFCAAALAAAGPERLAPLDEAVLQQVVAAHKGKVLLVNFWATWCAPCREEMPQLVKLDATLRSKGFRLVTVSADEPEDQARALQFLQKQAAPAPAYLKHANNDDKFISALDAKWTGALPASFLYDKSGHKVRSFIGEVSMTDLEAAIRKLL